MQDINQKIEELMQLKSHIGDNYKFSIDVYNTNEELQHNTTLNFSEKMALVDKFNKHYEDTNLKKMHVSCGIGEWQKLFGKNSLSDNEIEKIKVSIVLPIYNKANQGLSRGIESYLNQTHKNIEVICVNDASTDNSLDIIKEYAKKDNRIVIVDLKENRKCSGARIAGWEVATGDYITNVDPDDYIDNNYIEQMLVNIIALNIDVLKVYAPVPIKGYYAHYGAIGELPFLSEEWNDGYISVNVCGKIYKSSIIKQVLPELHNLQGINSAEDSLLNSVILSNARTIATVDIEAKYHYELNSESITNSKNFDKIIDDVLYANKMVKSRYNNFYTDRNACNHFKTFLDKQFGLNNVDIEKEKEFFLKFDKEFLATTLTFAYQNLNQNRLELRRLKKYKLDKIPKIVEKLFPYNSIQRNFGKLLYKLALSCYNTLKRAK